MVQCILQAREGCVRAAAQLRVLAVAVAPITPLHAWKAKPCVLHSCLPSQEYKIHNCDLLFKEDCSVDDLIDVIEGNRRYVKCEWVRWGLASAVCGRVGVVVPFRCGAWVRVSACHSALLCWDGGQSAACNGWAERTAHDKRQDPACKFHHSLLLPSHRGCPPAIFLRWPTCPVRHTHALPEPLAPLASSPTGLYVYNKMDICSMEEVRSPAPALPCRHPWPQ